MDPGRIATGPSMPLKKARRHAVSTDLNINSMMDMMTIILVFLLKSYSAQDISVTASEKLTLPVSSSVKAPELAVNLVVSKDRILVDGVEVLRLAQQPDPEVPGAVLSVIDTADLNGPLVDPLHDVLLEKARSSEAMAKALGTEKAAFQGRILLQADRDLHFSVLRQVMYTAGQARFGQIRFVVYGQG